MSTTSGARSEVERRGFLPVCRLADKLHVGERRQQLLESVPDDRVVVGDEDADHEIGTSMTNDVPAPGLDTTSR